MRPVAPVVPSRGPHKVRHRLQPEHQLRRLNIDAIDIKVVGSMNLGTMQFRAAHKQVDQPIRVRKV